MAEPEGGLLTTPDVAEGNQEQTTQWYSDEYKELVETKGWDDPNKFLGSYKELEKGMGGRLKMPTPESSAEEIRAFYQKTGCPENPDGYEITAPEGSELFRNEGVENSLKQIAYDQGVSKQAFESIVKGYYDQLNADAQANREQGEAALKQELGGKYEEEMTIARRFCEECSDEFRELLDSTGLGNSPIFAREFIRLGKKITSDTLIQGEGSGDKVEGYTPQYKDSPEMYSTAEGEEGEKARAYFKARGHKY